MTIFSPVRYWITWVPVLVKF